MVIIANRLAWKPSLEGQYDSNPPTGARCLKDYNDINYFRVDKKNL